MNTQNKHRILFVNAPEETIQAIGAVLERERFDIESADIVSCTDVIRRTGTAVAVLINPGIEQALQLVSRIRFISPWTQVIVTVDTPNTSELLAIVKAGAYDCLPLQITTADLSVRILKANEFAVMQSELVDLRQHVAMNYGFDNIVGVSKAISKVKEAVAKVAPTDVPIMLLGDTGTGRELLARVIHHHSNRRRNRFVTVDCSIANEDRLHLELFGNGENLAGALRDANNGTLFIDSIESMPAAVQARLAEFLKTSSLTDPKTGLAVRVDIRHITAGIAMLPQSLKEVGFVEELFYRLGVLPIRVPSLAERVEDIELLADYFLRKIAHETGGVEIGITRGAADKLVKHNWPGNVRELENTLRRAATLCRENLIDVPDIAFVRASGHGAETEGPHKTTFRKRTGLLDDHQRDVIVNALQENDWNFTQTAQELGIGRTTLWRKVKKYDLKKETVPA